MTQPASGTKTILFTDVEGSTDLRTRVGDEAAHRILRSHEEVVRGAIDENGGREIKSLGDGFMASFVSARSAIDCAVTIQRRFDVYAEEGLRIRVGLNTGEVREEAGDLYGSAVNAASRIAAAASGGQILVAAVVKELAGTMPGVEFVDRGLFWLKGFPERWRLYEVHSSVRRERTPSPVSAADRTPFVGREEERADLRQLLDQALTGRGALALIGGEPGLGKTRLAEEVAAEAANRGFLALTGRCYEMESPPPFMPLLEILKTAETVVPPDVLRESLGESAGEVARLLPELRSFFPDIPAPLELPPEQERRYLLSSIRDFFERTSRRRPLLLLLDDLHWADESSLLLLQHAAERLQEMPALIVGTYRDVELDVNRPLARTLDSLLRHRLAHRIALRRLPEDAVRQMLAGLAGQAPPDPLVAAVFAETEGNPFFVEEVYRHLAEEGRLLDEHGRFRTDLHIDELDVPESVRLVVGRRLERLSDAGRRALGAAAVIGRTFTFELLESVTDIAGDDMLDAMDQAEAARLLTASRVGRETEYRFAHELIRQTLLTGLSMPRRQRLHLRVADAIEALGAGGGRAMDLAHHLYQAGAAADAGRTVLALQAAGDQALSAAAFEDALRLCEEAFTLADEGGDRLVRAEILERLGRSKQALGRIDEAFAHWREALDLFAEEGARERVANVATAAAVQFAWAGRWEACLEMSQRGLFAAGDDLTYQRVYLQALAGAIVSVAGAYDTGREMVEEALALAERTQEREIVGAALAAKTLHHWAWIELEETIDAGMQTRELLTEPGTLWQLANILGFVLWSYMYLGRLDEAASLEDEVEPLAARLGNLGALSFATRARTIMGFTRDPDLERNLEEALDDLRLSERTASPLLIAQSHAWIGATLFRLGRWEEAFEHLVASRQERSVPGTFDGLCWQVEVVAMATAGERSALDRVADRTRDLPMPGMPLSWGSWSVLVGTVEARFLLDPHTDLSGLHPLVDMGMRRGMLFRSFDYRLVETVAAMTLASADPAASDGHFARALELAERLNQIEAPEIRRLWAVARLRRGESDQAAALAREAADLYRNWKMLRHAELAEALVAQAGS